MNSCMIFRLPTVMLTMWKRKWYASAKAEVMQIFVNYWFQAPLWDLTLHGGFLPSPATFHLPQRHFTLPDAIFWAHNAIWSSTTEIFMLTSENDPPQRGFVCPQRDLSGPCAISHGHNGIWPSTTQFPVFPTGIELPQQEFLCSQYINKRFTEFTN